MWYYGLLLLVLIGIDLVIVCIFAGLPLKEHPSGKKY